MRNYFIYILFFVLLSCTKKEKENFIPTEYLYPIENIGNGKQFNYYRVGSLHEKNSVVNLSIINNSKEQFLVKSEYCNGIKTDSIKTTLKGELLEIYNFNLLYKTQHEILKGKIIENKIIDDGSELGKRISKILYNGKYREVLVDQEEKFLYDTIINIDGLEHKALVTETKIKTLYKKNGIEYGNETLNKKSYYVKGFGLYSYGIESKDDSSKYFQMSIDNLKEK